MLKSYLKIACRNLWRIKGFTAINVIGLAVSFSVCLLVIALIHDQAGYDYFHPNADRTYRITTQVTESWGKFEIATSPAPLGPALRNEYPGVEQVVRLRRFGGPSVFDNQVFEIDGLYAEPSFFDIFGFSLRQGDAKTALTEPYALILTPETASLLFGEENPLGQVVTREGVGEFVVTGVFNELPTQTHLKFDALASFATIQAFASSERGGIIEDWNDLTSFYNYIVLADGTRPADVKTRSQQLLERNFSRPETPIPDSELQSITSINLGRELSNQISTTTPVLIAYVFGAFAALMMFLALFNYVSLSVARSLKRAREIGVRKVVGADRKQIVIQFLTESTVVAFLALMASFIVLIWLIPAFNNMQIIRDDFDLSAPVSLGSGVGVYVWFLIFTIFIGLIAGIYPAFVMSGYQPMRVLKGAFHGTGLSRKILRKSLVVTQFSLSIIGIVLTVIIYKQATLILHASYDFGEEELVNIELQDVSYETLKSELLKQPGVAYVAATSSPPSAGSNTISSIFREESMVEDMAIQFYSIDDAFLEQFGINLIAGEEFSTVRAANAIMITEAALAPLGFQSPFDALGHHVSFDPDGGSGTSIITGVVEDFYSQGYHRGYKPVVLTSIPARYRIAVVRVAGQNFAQLLERLAASWQSLAPNRPFKFGFYDDQLAERYRFVYDMIRVIGFVSIFIIMVACLGLLSLVSYSTEIRTKEVGIRKVLGATVNNLVVLLSREYVKLIALALLIATPLAWLLGILILQSHVNRVELDVWVLVSAIFPIIALALLTLGSQVIRAAMVNPVRSIEQE